MSIGQPDPSLTRSCRSKPNVTHLFLMQLEMCGVRIWIELFNLPTTIWARLQCMRIQISRAGGLVESAYCGVHFRGGGRNYKQNLKPNTTYLEKYRSTHVTWSLCSTDGPSVSKIVQYLLKTVYPPSLNNILYVLFLRKQKHGAYICTAVVNSFIRARLWALFTCGKVSVKNISIKC